MKCLRACQTLSWPSRSTDLSPIDNVWDMMGRWGGSVTKFECIGRIQKRVDSRLRKLKLNQKGLGGRWKLTDSFMDKLKTYYVIAIRSNVNNIEKTRSAVIAAFFHSCSKNNRPMHAQCPVGPDSWCQFRVAFHGKMHIYTGKGLP
ncbi:uncharacterized protein TNCV_2611731 [Trichonephila clavipes]|nr:uncharacterized protein TNCV_2611731 [Trichonephila clavipes]